MILRRPILVPGALGSWPRRAASGAVVAGLGQLVQCDTTAAAFTVSAPPAPVADADCFAVATGPAASAHPVTVSGNGNTIDGAASLVLAASAVDAVFVFTSGEWKRVVPVYQDEDTGSVVELGGQLPPAAPAMTGVTYDPATNEISFSGRTFALLAGTDATGAGVNLTLPNLAELSFADAKSVVVRVTVHASRTDAGARAREAHELLLKTTGGALTIEQDTQITPPGTGTLADAGDALAFTPTGLALRVACTGQVGQTWTFAALCEWNVLSGV